MKLIKITFNSIIGSDIFTFVVGPNCKEYKVHGAAISRLSKPLGVLINGEMREAKEKCVKWPDVDEKTFMRFTQWAYTETYTTEEPEIFLDHSLIGSPNSAGMTPVSPEEKTSEMALYSLMTENFVQPQQDECCWNKACVWYGRTNPEPNFQPTCLVCRRSYDATACASCSSVYTDCPNCGPVTRAIRSSCSNASCDSLFSSSIIGPVTCLRCRTIYSTAQCHCGSIFSDCVACLAENEKQEFKFVKRFELVHEFLDTSSTTYPTTTSVFSPRKNTEGCEDYTEVFLCHAKLYVMADTYDIPALKKLSLHRLHVTLKEFTLYPSRFNDIATLAKYVFENTVPEDKIRNMITLYYACIIEDAQKQDGLKSLIEEIPDFAYGLISKMSERLA